MLSNGHGGFGKRPEETDWPKDRHCASGRLRGHACAHHHPPPDACHTSGSHRWPRMPYAACRRLHRAEAEVHAGRWRCMKIRPRRCLPDRGRDCQPYEGLVTTARRAAALCVSRSWQSTGSLRYGLSCHAGDARKPHGQGITMLAYARGHACTRPWPLLPVGGAGDQRLRCCIAESGCSCIKMAPAAPLAGQADRDAADVWRAPVLPGWQGTGLVFPAPLAAAYRDGGVRVLRRRAGYSLAGTSSTGARAPRRRAAVTARRGAGL